MNIALKWGREEVALDIPDHNVLGVLSPSPLLSSAPVGDLQKAVEYVLARPTWSIWGRCPREINY